MSDKHKKCAVKQLRQSPLFRISRLIANYLCALALALLGILSIGAARAGAPEICVPVGTGGAYSSISGGYPKFWDTASYSFNSCNENSFDRFNKWIDDPRWDGATSITYGDGTTDIVQFRAVQREVEDHNYLFLSWWVKDTASLDDYSNNALYVGLRPNDDTSPGVVLEVRLRTAETVIAATTHEADNPAITKLFVVTDRFLLRSEPYTADNDERPLPDWAETVRVWIGASRDTPGPSNCPVGPAVKWAVHLRVPLGEDISPDTDLPVELGDSSDRFRLWYTTQIGVAPDEYRIPMTWPRSTNEEALCCTEPDCGNFDLNYCGGSPDPLKPDATPLFSEWGTVYLSAGEGDTEPSCMVGGIDIEPEDIEVTYPGSTEDNWIGLPESADSPAIANTFSATPTNKSGADIPRNALHARFRLANWGAQLSDNVPLSGTGEWNDVDGLGDVSDEDPDEFVENGQEWNITKPRSFGHGDFEGKSPHQCIQVELSGSTEPPANAETGGLRFLRSSAYRNMSTVSTSTFREKAEVSLVGLMGGSSRDVYLHVIPINMPRFSVGEARVPPIKFDPDKKMAATRIESGGSEKGMNPTETDERSITQPEFERRAETEPTYIVRAFFDTGRRVPENGKQLTVLQPMVSFGYFARHSGDPAGWRHELGGAERIPGTDDWYKLRVDGKEEITITLQSLTWWELLIAILVEWWWLILIAIVVLALFLLWRRAHA